LEQRYIVSSQEKVSVEFATTHAAPDIGLASLPHRKQLETTSIFIPPKINDDDEQI
jgi:hypothetical protein